MLFTDRRGVSLTISERDPQPRHNGPRETQPDHRAAVSLAAGYADCCAVHCAHVKWSVSHESYDLPRTWWTLRSRAISADLGRNDETMTKHVIEKHPDTAKAMERMHNEDPKKWGRDTKPKWDARTVGRPLDSRHRHSTTHDVKSATRTHVYRVPVLKPVLPQASRYAGLPLKGLKLDLLDLLDHNVCTSVGPDCPKPIGLHQAPLRHKPSLWVVSTGGWRRRSPKRGYGRRQTPNGTLPPF